jgi:bacillithiol synthase
MRTLKIDLKDLYVPKKLIHQYLNQEDSLNDLIQDFPSLEAFDHQMRSKAFSLDKRLILTEVLEEQYQGVQTSESVWNNIKFLKEEDTYTITTGHQLCIYTGPLFFIHKLVSVVKLSQDLKAKYPSKHFVPVYWMATEDHDFEEINHFHLYNNKYIWESHQEGPVGRYSIDGLLEATQESFDKLGESETSKYLINLFKKAYQAENNLAKATQILVNGLFEAYGLVVLDADDSRLKSLFSSHMSEEIVSAFSEKAVLKTTENWQDKVQVNPRSCNLFYMLDGFRVRLESEGGQWKTVDNKYTWSQEDLLKDLEKSPERFSPNVILRPLYQETILPNLAYLGGPGELAYWFELKGLFDEVEEQFPLLIHRDSFLLVQERVQKKLDKIGIELTEFYKDIDTLVRENMEQSDSNLDISYLKDKWQRDLEELKEPIENIDLGLSKSLQGEWMKVQKVIDNLNAKITRGVKRKEEQKVKALEGLKNSLFPNNGPQERYESFIAVFVETEGRLIDYLIKEANCLENKQSILFL